MLVRVVLPMRSRVELTESDGPASAWCSFEFVHTLERTSDPAMQNCDGALDAAFVQLPVGHGQAITRELQQPLLCGAELIQQFLQRADHQFRSG